MKRVRTTNQVDEVEKIEHKKRKRFNQVRVMFSETEEWIDNPTKYLSSLDISNLWWESVELCRFKDSAKAMGRNLRRQSGTGVSSSLTMASQKTTLLLKSDYQKLMQLPLSRPDEDLQQWCIETDGRRGLERFTCAAYRAWSRTDVMNARRAVFAEQELQRDMLHYDPKKIAKVSREISRRSRTFASFMGAADAVSFCDHNTKTISFTILARQ